MTFSDNLTTMVSDDTEDLPSPEATGGACLGGYYTVLNAEKSLPCTPLPITTS